jgi:MFS family permease
MPDQRSWNRDAKVIGLVGLAHGVSHFYHMLLASLFPWLKDAFQLSFAQLGMLMTVFFVVSGVGQALAGFVVDKLGARKVLLFGVSCLLASSIFLSFASHYTMLLLGAMLAGLGNSVFHPADFTLLNQCVSTQRISHAFSVHGLSGNLGWAAAPMVLVPLAVTFDWRYALLIASLIPAMVWLLLVVNQGLFQIPSTTSTLPDPIEEHAETQVKVASSEGTFSFLTLPAVWFSFGFFFMLSMALGGIQSFSSSAFRDVYGMSLASATSAYTAYMLASAAGTAWGGFIAAKTQHQDKTIARAFAGAGVLSCILATGLVATPIVIVMMACMGFAAGIAGPARDLLIRQAAPKNATGRVYGMVYSGLDIGLAFSPLLFGALMDKKLSAWVFVGIGVFQLLAILTALNVGKRSLK